MNITTLKTFLTVIEAGNLNKASEQLNVTQSTVTARLDALESILGRQLLVRARRGAELTKAGFALQRHAELAVQAWEQARKAVGLPTGFSGLFSLACQPDLWDAAASAWLDEARQNHPEIAFEAWPGAVPDIKRWLGTGLVDAALATETISGPGLAGDEFGRDRLVQVSTRKRRVQRWDPDYIFVDLGPEFRRRHSRAWPVDETAHMTFGSSDWALGYLLRHGGSAYLPWRLTEPLVAGGRLHPVSGAAEFEQPLYLSWRDASAEQHPWIAGTLPWNERRRQGPHGPAPANRRECE